jgi:hypothetical protein|tara:strand:+ start:1132 stop:1497 length:366 start_codon:yes stop_codon:yes gene_type:complete
MKITKLIKLLQQIDRDFKKEEPWEDELEVEMSIDEEGNDFHDIATDVYRNKEMLYVSLSRYKTTNSLVVSLYPHQYDKFGDFIDDERYHTQEESEKIARNLRKKHYKVEFDRIDKERELVK